MAAWSFVSSSSLASEPEALVGGDGLCGAGRLLFGRLVAFEGLIIRDGTSCEGHETYIAFFDAATLTIVSV
jgi:hypothetical protein